jgi:hypothetical protein
MQKPAIILLPLLFCSFAFGQIDSNSITVTAANNTSLQPDQVVFGITVQSGISTGLDDVLTALQGSGITAANLVGVTSAQQPIVSRAGSTLQWTFSLAAPLTNTKATIASLTTLEQTIAMQNNGLTLSFSIVGTQVSPQLAQSQTCSLSSLITSATTQAQSLAAAANLNVGRILSLSSSTSNTGLSSGGIFAVFGAVSFSTSSAVPAPCGITIRFALTGY